MVSSVRAIITRRRLLAGNLVLGGIVIAFDLSRKTIFRSASWNYDYPAHRFMFDIPILLGLIIALILSILAYRRMQDAPRNVYLLAVYGLTLLLGTLSFWSLPVTSTSMALTPETTQTSHDFLYFPATFLIENGPVAYVDSFHQLPTISGQDRRETAIALGEILARSEFLPFNEYYSNYVSGIVTQRHGPVPPLLIAPFMLVLGVSPEAAVTGAYVLTALTPVIAYFAFRLYFSEQLARFGGLYVAFTPALYIWLRHKAIPYDAMTGLLIAITVYCLLRGIKDEKLQWMGAAGFTFSLAALSKISVLPFGLPILVAIVVYKGRQMRALVAFSGAFFIIPVIFLFFGYDFIAQYMFDLGRVLSVEQASSAGGSSNRLRDVVIAWYNVRLLGTPFVLLAIAGLIQLPELVKSHRKHHLIGVAFLLSGAPFLLLFGMTTSRHLLGLLTPLVFFTLIVLDRLVKFDERFAQSSLAIGSLLLLVNL